MTQGVPTSNIQHVYGKNKQTALCDMNKQLRSVTRFRMGTLYGTAGAILVDECSHFITIRASEDYLA